jgi:hypothetical protein
MTKSEDIGEKSLFGNKMSLSSVVSGNLHVPHETFLNDLSVINHRVTEEFSATFDYVIVFPLLLVHGKREQNDITKHVMHTMLDRGFELYPYLSVQDDELICLIRCPVRCTQLNNLVIFLIFFVIFGQLEVLKKFADQIDYKLLLDSTELETTLLAGDIERKIASIDITHDESITKITPYQFGKPHHFFSFSDNYSLSSSLPQVRHGREAKPQVVLCGFGRT